MLTVSVPQTHDFEGKTCKGVLRFRVYPLPQEGATTVTSAYVLTCSPLILLKTVCHFWRDNFFLKKLSTILTFSTLTNIYI